MTVTLRKTNQCCPYGLPMPASSDYQGNDYKYGGKEFDMFQKMNIYDFVARTYVPDEARFWQPDPRAGDYRWLSPYAFCAADPVNKIDPNGVAIYYVNMFGQYITAEETGLTPNKLSEYEKEGKTCDRIVIIDKSGGTVKAIPSDKYDVGTIMPYFSGINPPGTEGAFTCTEVIGDHNAGKIFKFLAENITAKNGVEFGLNLMDEDPGNSRNDIIAGFTEGRLCGLPEVYILRKSQGRIFREFIHSHKGTSYPSEGDMLSARSIAEGLSKQVVPPKFGLYVGLKKTYIPYDYKQGYFINYCNRLEYTSKPLK